MVGKCSNVYFVFLCLFRMFHVRQSWCYCTLHTVSVVYTNETKNLFMNRGEKCTYFVIFFTFFSNILNNFVILVHLHVFYLPGISYILVSVLLSCGSVWTRWFLSSSSMAWYKYILSFESFANLNVSFFISLKFSLPLLQWWPSWISDRHKKQKVCRGPSNDHSWAAWFQLSKWFQRRSILKHFSHRVQC